MPSGVVPSSNEVRGYRPQAAALDELDSWRRQHGLKPWRLLNRFTGSSSPIDSTLSP